MPAPPSDSFRSRPLPPVPTDPPVTVSSCPTEPPSAPQTQNPGYNPNDSRNSILTFTSVGTNLPRYSAIDFLDPNFSLEQVDHWTEAGDSLVVVAGSDAGSSITSTQPPEYTSSTAGGPATTKQRPPRFVLHKFHLGGQSKKIVPHKGKQPAHKPWATLKLVSRPPALGSRVKTPRFIGGDVIRGSLDLCMGTPMNVHSMKLILRGKVQLAEGLTSSSSLVSKEHIFLDESYDIYLKKDSTDPRWNGQCEISKNKESDGSLHGSYAFPFSLPFPAFAECRSSKGKEKRDSREGSTVPVLTYDVPPSFREQNMSSAVVYELGVVIVHGRLRSKSKINTEVIFVPKKVSPPASSKRQTAYQEGALLPGPITDPEGWSAMKPTAIQGQFEGRTVEATGTLYLAKPLSYTRGTVIPCYLTFSSLDFAFLDALSTPHATDLRLSRCITHSSLGRGNENTKTDTASWQKTYITTAAWWNPPKTDAPLDLKERHLEGEVHLPKSLIPSCSFPFFTVEYVLELLPVQVESFTQTRESKTKLGQHEAEEKDGRPILKSLIDITTFHEHGPIPVAFTTPVVEDKKERQMRMKVASNLEYIPYGPMGAAGGLAVQITPIGTQ